MTRRFGTMTVEREIQDAQYAELPPPLPGPPSVEIARAELVLARPDHESLALTGLEPDPLQGLAQVFRRVDWDAGERLYVDLSLSPATPWKRRRIRRRLVQESERRPDLWGRLLREHHSPGLFNPQRRALDPTERTERNYEQSHLQRKVGNDQALFEPQILIRAEAPNKERAKGLVREVETSLRMFAGQNYWRRAGFGIPGLLFLSTDHFRTWQRWFDRRWETGLHMPIKRSVISTTEVMGLLKPPTKNCHADNVERSGGRVAPAPKVLPPYLRQAGTFPLGRVSDGRTVGLPVPDTYFAYLPGRSRYGKTELATNVFLHMALVEGHGALFVDPAADAIRRMKPYLADPAVAGRVVEINIHGRGPQPGWNPLSMEGLGREDLPEKLGAVVNAITAVQGWSEQTNARAVNLTLQSVQVLLELALVLDRPELNPTIFQIPTLLTDSAWRNAVLQALPPALTDFWRNEFAGGTFAKDAVPPVTNMIRTMRSYPALAALLGSPRSTFDMRRAMDDGQIVLVCPGARNSQGRMLANLLVYELVRAGLSRQDMPEVQRMDRRFWAFLDELQSYDGAVSGSIADIFEQTAKFGLGAFAMNQEPERLKRDTLLTLLANRSHLITTAVSYTAAGKLMKGQLHAPDAETVSQLPRYTYIADVTIGHGGRPAPFQVQGQRVEDIWSDMAYPERLGDLDAAMDRNFGRRPIEDAVQELDALDGAILEALQPQSVRGRTREPAIDLPPEPELEGP